MKCSTLAVVRDDSVWWLPVLPCVVRLRANSAEVFDSEICGLQEQIHFLKCTVNCCNGTSGTTLRGPGHYSST